MFMNPLIFPFPPSFRVLSYFSHSFFLKTISEILLFCPNAPQIPDDEKFFSFLLDELTVSSRH